MPNDTAVSDEKVCEADVLEEINPPFPTPERRKTLEAWSFTVEERRTSRRLEGHLPTVLYCGDRSWRGIAKSISFGGVSLALAGDVPALLNQHIRLRLSARADGLDSLGIVCGIRTSADVISSGGVQCVATLAVQFVRLSAVDAQVVASLCTVEGSQPYGMHVAAALVIEESEETLIDTGSPSTMNPSKSGTCSMGGRGGPSQERRRHRRLAVGPAPEALFRNRDGDSMLVRPERNSPGSMEVGGKTMSSAMQCFSAAKDTVSVIDSLLAPSEARATEGGPEGPSVISEFSECFRTSGSRIVLCHDRPAIETTDDAPIVVLAPGYGESKRDYVPLAYYLAGNGFHVVRYDNVNHVGESDGVVTQFRLQDMESDLETVLHHVAASWPGRSIGLVATSLAGRVALKVTGGASHVKLLVLINGIMDVRHTLQAVHQEDLIGEHLAGIRKGIVNILGLTIDADCWLAHAVQGNYADLATTQRDAERLQTPLVLFHAERDAWVDPSSIRTVEAAVGPYLRHSYVVPGALHRLQESPRKARTVYREIALSCRRELWPDRPLTLLIDPSHREIGAQNRIERERGKARRSIGKSDHVAFWKEYLHNFQTIPNVADFWHLMDHVYRLMGDCHHGERILDAGCGNGNFGVFLQLNQAFRQRYARRGDFRSPSYLGVDFVPAALAQATANFAQVDAALQEQCHEGLRAYVPMSMRVYRADLESPLPFPDHSFDRVVCNLVIGYVRDPLFTLREYLRVLAPHGRLVVSNLKPYADLSAIYRNFVETAQTPDQVEEGRRLLDNSGKIKEREGEGLFHFLHHAELENLLRAAGVSHPRVYSTFGNQALIAVAEKDLASLTVAA